ncbi:UNKNOWN [Stylonychia lemnae]|uniref:Uncharacterized protein n=1 Tax=Stylonychia lemnae TaxID=5949 RepID=A0A078B471_STYLE|nr:UNKNOWN [Stylonychia lemnae]|eukprot:CDW88303.1 UNKNOWN [Stylonychia lemnae]
MLADSSYVLQKLPTSKDYKVAKLKSQNVFNILETVEYPGRIPTVFTETKILSTLQNEENNRTMIQCLQFNLTNIQRPELQQNLSIYITSTYDQCLLRYQPLNHSHAILKGVRADEIKIGDSTIIQLHSYSRDSKEIVFENIEKIEVAANTLKSVKTDKGYYITESLIISDQEMTCTQEFIIDILSEDSQNLTKRVKFLN